MFQLASHLGWPTVEWGLERISSYEISQWLAFARHEPLGERRADLRSAYLIATLHNINKGKDDSPTQASDIMERLFDFWGDHRVAYSDQDYRRLADQLGSMFGGVVKHDQKF